MKNLGLAPLQALPPDGVEYQWVEPASGRRSAEGCEAALLLPFAYGSAPRDSDDCAANVGGSLLDRLFD